MTLDEIKQHQYYAQLSQQQRVYVDRRCSGDPAVEAAKAAWNCRDERSAYSLSRRAEKNANIKALLKMFFADRADVEEIPSREELASWAWRKAQLSSIQSGDAYKFAQMVERIMGYTVKPTEQTPQKPTDDGDEIFQPIS